MLNHRIVMNSTPRELARNFSRAEIESVLKSCALGLDGTAEIIGSGNPVDWANTTGYNMIDVCEDLLREWYDLNGEVRPAYSAAHMAEAMVLYSAWQL